MTVESFHVIVEDGSLHVTLTATERAALVRSMDYLTRLFASDTRSLPNRDHPLLARFLVDPAFTDPVRCLEFRMGYDQATLSLMERRLVNVTRRLTLSLPWAGKDLDDLLGALTAVRVYACWRVGLELGRADLDEAMRQLARSESPEADLARHWLWVGILLHETAEAASEL